MVTIFKEASNEQVKELSPSKKAGEEGIETLNANSEEIEWENKYKTLLEVLAEKNIVNFMNGIDMCCAYITKAIAYNRKLIQERLIELLKPVIAKIDTVNKRVRVKCREFILSFWRLSIENNYELHTSIARYLVAPEQHKICLGAMELFKDVIQHLEESKVVEQRRMEEGLGVGFEIVLKLSIGELGNKTPQIRKVSYELLAKLVDLIDTQPNKVVKAKSILVLEGLFRSMKSSVKEKIFEKLNKDIVAELKRLAEDKSSPEKGAAEEDKLIYAEPLNENMKNQLQPVLAYFSETIIQCLYSQNWASRLSALNKIKEELRFALTEDNTIQRHINISRIPITKAITPWTIILKQIISDPVMKIYIDGLELVKEALTIFKKHITNKEELTKTNEQLTNGIIEKLGDQKPKIREKSISLLLSLLKDELINPEVLSARILKLFENAKGSGTENQLCSTLKVCRECTLLYRVTESNQKMLSEYMKLLNKSLKHSMPAVRQLAEELYVALYEINGNGINQYLVNQKPVTLKKLQSLCKEDIISPKSRANVNQMTQSISLSSLKILHEPGCKDLLSSEDPTQRIQGLIMIKKNVSKQQASKEMDPDRAHGILDELTMLMRTILNETNPEVYLEALKLIKFSLNQLLKHLSPFDLQITVNNTISILMPRTIASPNYRIQVASDKFIVSLGKDPLIGPIIIVKNIFRLLDKLAAENMAYHKALRMSGTQSGFGKQANTGFDLGQNVAAVVRYLGIANIMLTHYKTDISNSKEAVDFFCDTAVNLFTAYAEKCQIKEEVSQYSRNIRLVNPKAFDIPLSKKSSEVKEKLEEILNAAPGEFEEKQLGGRESIWGKVSSTKSTSINDTRSSMLPSVHLSNRKEEQKQGKNLPSYSKRIGRIGEGIENVKASGEPDKVPQALPPLIFKRTQPADSKKPNWLDEKEDSFERKSETAGTYKGYMAASFGSRK